MTAARFMVWWAVVVACVLAVLAAPLFAHGEGDPRATWYAEASAAGHATTPLAYAAHVEALGDPIGAVRIVWEGSGASWSAIYSIMACETGHTFNVRSTGRAGERGLFQILGIHQPRIRGLGYSWDDMYRAVPNAVVALDLWQRSGWQPWSCRYAINAPGGW